MTADLPGRVAGLMTRVLAISQDEVPSAQFGVTESWDSLQHIELVFQLEEEFGVRFPESALAELSDFARVCDAVASIHGS